ncbi:Calcium-activated potassium channel subunit alpha-1 [Schistosoma japonicum]|uniref:Calcium-activated potassium channel subunit alpha-1 n=1 Tax=Schistosoma japonicum TaxID=6182 RepID=A0A4Z2D143_SCHJA|nr:Calcium-activated potassium channel subunit alpha-1 [Schistosoma japonicum]
MVTGSLLIYLITLSRRRRKKGDVDEENLRKLLRFKNPLWLPKYAKITLSGKNYLGRFLILSRTLACLVCMTIYLWNSHRTERATCNTLNKQWSFYLELSLFGFLYFARLTRIPESLVLLRIINQERSIRIVNLIFKLLAAWTVIAGFVLVLESLGNFWVIGNTYRSLEYLDCLYMILVTLATVGYGDIVCTSYLGRIFIIFVIIGALITVTTHISELSELFQQHNQYHKGIYMEHIPRHIVVCGSINYSTLSTFYEEYVNADKGHYDENMMIVILSEIDPDIRLMALLQRESTTMRFLKGSVTLPEDLERAKVRTAEAVIILSNKCSQTPVEDDWKNLMCVVAIKNLNSDIRIICELMLIESKAWMSNIPGWKEYESDKFDRAICLPQMKLGLLALNCLASGISTLLCNFIMRDSVPTNSVRKTLPRWINEYFEGTKYKLYTVKFSHALDGMLFQQLVGLAMEFWGVLLLAVQVYTDNNKKTQMIINPGVRVRINTYRMRAVVLAKNLIEAQRLRTYTMDNQITFDNYGQVILSPLMRNTDSIYEKTKPFSTTGTNLVKMIGKCFNIFRQPFIIYNKIRGNKVIQKVSKHPSTFSMNSYHHHLHPDSTIVDFVLLKKLNSIDLQCDSTGLFYWVTERKFSNICLTMKEMIRCQFKNHIIVCITKQAKGIKLGLASFVLPLRSTSISIEELKPIIILCEAKVIENEWRSLKNLPNIYVFSGSPLNRANLRAAGVERCSTCVVLSSLYDNSGRPSLMVDKESILCTLNIRQLLADANKTSIFDTEGRNHPVLVTELYDISNASLLSTNSKCGSTYFNPLVASGNIFESNVLHSLSSNVLFDPTVITFIETILGGGPGHEVEKVFAIDSGFFPGLRGQPVSTLMFPDYLTGNIPSQEDDKNEYDRNVSNEVQNTLSTIVSDSDLMNTEQNKTFLRRNNLSGNILKFSAELRSRQSSDCYTDSNRNTIYDIFNDAELTKEKTDFNCREVDNEQINVKSFLSYKTATGESIAVRLSQLRLIPLLELDNELYQLSSQGLLTFSQLFHAVLVNTGTISIGLYRSVNASNKMDDDLSCKNMHHEVSGKIERFVYTLPEPITPIYPDDMIYCLTAMTEDPMA